MYKLPEDFAGGAVVKHPPASAGEHKFDPWPRKTPHAMWRLSPRSGPPVPRQEQPLPRNQRAAAWLTQTRGSPQQWGPSAAKT